MICSAASLREHWLGWLMQTRARQPLNGLILTLDLPDLLTADKSRRETLVQNLRQQLQEIRQSLALPSARLRGADTAGSAERLCRAVPFTG